MVSMLTTCYVDNLLWESEGPAWGLGDTVPQSSSK